MHLGFAFDSAEQLRLGFQPVFHGIPVLGTLLLINGVGPASHRLRCWGKSRYDLNYRRPDGRLLCLDRLSVHTRGRLVWFHAENMAGKPTAGYGVFTPLRTVYGAKSLHPHPVNPVEWRSATRA